MGFHIRVVPQRFTGARCTITAEDSLHELDEVGVLDVRDTTP
jgi:hypothetical protein